MVNAPLLISKKVDYMTCGAKNARKEYYVPAIFLFLIFLLGVALGFFIGYR
jgi:hypothetical protein